MSHYAPNTHQDKFFETVLQTLQPHFLGTVVLGGDSNTPFDLSSDKSNPQIPKAKRPPKRSLRVAQTIQSHGLVDIWREMNPRTRDYTHYSIPHRTHSRIDHIFVLSHTIPRVEASKIHDTSLSDHSIMTLTLKGGVGERGPFKWRLNEALLRNPAHCTLLDTTLAEYFLDNNTDSISPGTLWEAHKAVMRGRLIQLSFQIRQERRAEIQQLMEDFCALSKRHKSNPTPDSLAKLDSARVRLNLSLTSSAEKHLRWTGARFYYQKDRIGSKLAAKLSPKTRVLAYPKIRTKTGNLTQNPMGVMNSFHDFYSHLYKALPQSHPKTRTAFLQDLNLPHLKRTHQELLDKPFSPDEIVDVIKSLKLASAPGPDGFSVCYYKKF